jgi:hypothetical protein
MTPVGFSMLHVKNGCVLLFSPLTFRLFPNCLKDVKGSGTCPGGKPTPANIIHRNHQIWSSKYILSHVYPRRSRFWLVLNFHVSLWLSIARKFPKHPSILIGDRCPCFLVKLPYFDAFPKCWWWIPHVSFHVSWCTIWEYHGIHWEYSNETGDLSNYCWLCSSKTMVSKRYPNNTPMS